MQEVSRLGVVWDTYREENIKNCTREKCGAGVCVKVGAQAKIPAKWNDFLQDMKNKQELFHFLTDKVDLTDKA